MLYIYPNVTKVCWIFGDKNLICDKIKGGLLLYKEKNGGRRRNERGGENEIIR